MQAHPNMTLENRNKRKKAYVENGAKLSEWHMWVALETYMQVTLLLRFQKKVFALQHKKQHIFIVRNII